MGVLYCLSQIFKKGHRCNLFPYADVVLKPCLIISTQPNETLTRKLLAKLFQRIALVYLPPRVAAWRYHRGSRSLVENMQRSGLSVIESSVGSGTILAEGDINPDDVPIVVEEVIDQLLCFLRDKDTVVSR